MAKLIGHLFDERFQILHATVLRCGNDRAELRP